MRKQTKQYDMPIDALVAIIRRLIIFENRYRIESEEFFDKFSKGNMEDSVDFTEWSNDYQHYLALRSEIERQLRYDSTPHFRDLDNFPHHKHLSSGIESSKEPSVIRVIDETAKLSK